MHLILIVLLIVLLLGVLPGVGMAPAAWGYYPTGGLGLVLLIVVVLLLAGRL